jgi:hypothetical protein
MNQPSQPIVSSRDLERAREALAATSCDLLLVTAGER